MNDKDQFDFDKEFEEFKKRINQELEKNKDSESDASNASSKINIDNPTPDTESESPKDNEEINFSDADYFDYHHMDVMEENVSDEEYVYEEGENAEIPVYTGTEEASEIPPAKTDFASPIDESTVSQKEGINQEEEAARGGEKDGEKISEEGESFYSETVRDSQKKRKKQKFRRALALTLIGSITGGSFLGLFIGVGSSFAKDYISKQPKEPYVMQGGSTSDTKGEDTPAVTAEPIASDPVSRVVSDVKPSVVTITVTINAQNAFFNIPQQAAGSGIIFEDDGERVYIVTNKHVIENATAVGIAVGDAEPVSAKLVGRSADTDLAVIYVEKAELQAAGVSEVVVAKFGDSDKMMVGDTVVAIGNALGEGNTATRGIISAQNKEISISSTETINAIQTDAAINEGNSGGALINLNSEVVGINTAKLKEVAVEGMGYSIPSNEVVTVIEEIMNNPDSQKVYLGIAGNTLSAEMAETYNLPAMGVIVAEVTEGLGAKAAGVQPYDIITAIDGETVFDFQTLQEKLKTHKEGDVVTLKILRNGSEAMEIDVKLMVSNEAGF